MGINTVVRFSINFLMSLTMILAYVCIGALVFVELESATEKENKANATATLKEFQKKYNLTDDDIAYFLKTFKAVHKDASTIQRIDVDNSSSIWTFEGAFYFCTTAITTIGTGNITPNTTSGQWFCIFYVLIGIPLLSLFFGMTGYYLTQILRLIILKFENLTKWRLELKTRQWAFVMITWTVGGLALLFNALWMAEKQTWHLGESFYYSLTTFSTIGFGDYTYYNDTGDDFPLVITSFVVLTIMLPASNLMFSTTAELFQTFICPLYLNAGIVKKSELQRILAEDQLLYRYRKMRKQLNNYNSFVPHDDELDAMFSNDSAQHELLNDSSYSHEVMRNYLDCIESDSSCGDPTGSGENINGNP